MFLLYYVPICFVFSFLWTLMVFTGNAFKFNWNKMSSDLFPFEGITYRMVIWSLSTCKHLCENLILSFLIFAVGNMIARKKLCIKTSWNFTPGLQREIFFRITLKVGVNVLAQYTYIWMFTEDIHYKIIQNKKYTYIHMDAMNWFSLNS